MPTPRARSGDEGAERYLAEREMSPDIFQRLIELLRTPGSALSEGLNLGGPSAADRQQLNAPTGMPMPALPMTRPVQAAPGQDPRQAAPSAAPPGWGPPPNPNTRPGML